MKCHNCGYPLPKDSEYCQYCGKKLETTSIEENISVTHSMPQDVVDIETPSDSIPYGAIFLRAYKSYLSDNPEEKQYFEHMRGSAELRVAYLEECARNKKELDSGVHINYKQSYLDFMSILNDEYFSKPITASKSPAISRESVEITTATITNVTQKKSRQRYCKHCGTLIDITTKKCTRCGRKYSKAKLAPLYTLLALLVLFLSYIGVNYFCAIHAMNNQQFIKSKQYFDNLFVSKTVFCSQYDYVEAGVLMETGDYRKALYAFNKVNNIPVPKSITDSIRDAVYSDGQSAYDAGDLYEAKLNFNALSGYKRSDDYIVLITCANSSYPNFYYEKLVKLLGFENTDEIILKNQGTAELFLEGRWEEGTKNSSYFEMYEDDEGDLHSRHNLPHKNSSGYYYISNGIYSVGETEANSAKYYKFSIIDEDTISVYCYKDGSTHKLYRQ